MSCIIGRFVVSLQSVQDESQIAIWDSEFAHPISSARLAVEQSGSRSRKFGDEIRRGKTPAPSQKDGSARSARHTSTASGAHGIVAASHDLACQGRSPVDLPYEPLARAGVVGQKSVDGAPRSRPASRRHGTSGSANHRGSGSSGYCRAREVRSPKSLSDSSQSPAQASNRVAPHDRRPLGIVEYFRRITCSSSCLKNIPKRRITYASHPP